MKIELYGHSDDCIELEGGIREEYNAYSTAAFLHFSDGTVIECQYSPPDDKRYFWRFKTLLTGNGTHIERVDGTYHGEDDGMICDRLIIEGEITHVRCFDTATGPSKEFLVDFMDRYDDWRVVDKNELRKIYDVLKQGEDS